MKKYYSEPKLVIRNYKLIPGNVVMTSDPNAGGDTNLNDGNEQNPWGNGKSNAPLFNE